MRFKKSACALLLGGSLSVLNIGCAAVDALVSSPAGHSAHGGSPQRIAAIGRVFENQGRYAQARAMYRQALRSDPNNTTAKDRLQYLASLESPATRQTATDEAFAVADVVSPPKRSVATDVRVNRTAPQAPERADEPSIQMVRAFESVGEIKSAALSVGGELESAVSDSSPIQPDVVAWQIEVGKVADELDSIADPFGPGAAGHVALVSSSESVPGETPVHEEEEIGVVSRQEASHRFEFEALTQPVAATVSTLECTELELFPESQQTERVGLWRPARSNVSLSSVLQWSDAPQDHESQLIDATRNGVDAGVRALAVSLLGEIERPGHDIVAALQQSAMTQVPMVRAAALDALVLRGHGDSETVDGLLSLLTGDDASIQAQAAGTLIRMANTEWRDDAIAGLHQLLNDGNDEVVAVAATSLSEFGAGAIGSRERLTAVAATTSSELVLEATSMALSRIPRAER